MIPNEQIAHELAMAYIHNRYSAEVTGDFHVSGDRDDLSGWGTVKTERLPSPEEVGRIKVGTGERALMGLVEKKVKVDDGYKVEPLFKAMVADYQGAYSHFLGLLSEE